MGVLHVGLTIIRRHDRTPIDGTIRLYDRPAGSRIWTQRVEAENVILNQWYFDLFGQIGNVPLERPGGIDLAFTLLALGYGNVISVPPARTDTGLVFEWTNAVTMLTTAALIAGGAITSIAVKALPLAILSGATIKLRTQVLTLTGNAAVGDVSIAVASFTPAANYPINEPVTYADITIHVPQRLPLSANIIDPTDPTSVVLSYYLAAASNSTPIAFTEAALMYTTGSMQFGSHVAFAYTKSGNTDVRVDYTLARESDE